MANNSSTDPVQIQASRSDITSQGPIGLYYVGGSVQITPQSSAIVQNNGYQNINIYGQLG